MVDSFDGLRHDTVIGSNDQDGNIRQLSASGTHSGECFMARGIQECDLVTLVADLVSTDSLGDAAGFVESDICLAQGVKQCRLAVVDMAHDRNDRRTRYEETRIIRFRNVFRRIFFLFRFQKGYTEFFSKDFDGIRIEVLIDGSHDAKSHQVFDDLADFAAEKFSQFLDGNSSRDSYFCRIGILFLFLVVFLLLTLVQGAGHQRAAFLFSSCLFPVLLCFLLGRFFTSDCRSFRSDFFYRSSNGCRMLAVGMIISGMIVSAERSAVPVASGSAISIASRTAVSVAIRAVSVPVAGRTVSIPVAIRTVAIPVAGWTVSISVTGRAAVSVAVGTVSISVAGRAAVSVAVGTVSISVAGRAAVSVTVGTVISVAGGAVVSISGGTVISAVVPVIIRTVVSVISYGARGIFLSSAGFFSFLMSGFRFRSLFFHFCRLRRCRSFLCFWFHARVSGFAACFSGLPVSRSALLIEPYGTHLRTFCWFLGCFKFFCQNGFRPFIYSGQAASHLNMVLLQSVHDLFIRLFKLFY